MISEPYKLQLQGNIKRVAAERAAGREPGRDVPTDPEREKRARKHDKWLKVHGDG